MTRIVFSAFALSSLIAGLANKLVADEIQFVESLIAEKYMYCYGVAAADLDGDGDLDLTNGDTTGNAFFWFENDGRGSFKRHTIQENETGWFERHAIGDLNGDGKPDVVVVKNLDGHLVWFENSGRPAQDRAWKRHVVSTDIKRAYDAAIVDLNGDGRKDVVASAWSGNHIAWFANPGAAGGEWKKEMIDPQLTEARTVRIGDFNGDGKPDVLGTGRAAHVTAWYEQSSIATASWKKHVIDDTTQQPVHGEPVDMDKDGDTDVVMALGMIAQEDDATTNQVVWYENVGRPGKGDNWKKHLVARLPYAFEAVAADLDGDGDRDIVATAWGGAGQVAWLENSGDPASGWKLRVIKSPWARANQPIVVDVDGDGRLDIVATAEKGANELRWWKNKRP